MIVSYKHKFVYMNIGKTGSISIGNLLQKEFDAFVWQNWQPSARKPKCAPEHVCHLPEQFADFTVISSVRNPFTHEMSRHTHGSPNYRTFPITMKSFEKWLRRTWMETYFSKINMSESYIPPEGCVRYKVNHIIHLENIQEDFNKLPFVTTPVEVLHENKTQNDQSCLYYTQELADLVRKARSIDFELFGYSKQLPKEMQKIKCL